MSTNRGEVLVVGSHDSALARWQAAWVVDRLKAAWPGLACRIEYFTSSGDHHTDQSLTETGRRGILVDDLAHALKSHKIDLAVHSLKDLSVDDDTDGLTIGAICERADARDALVAAAPCTLETLPAMARIGVSSLRRLAQLRAIRPDLTLLPIYGNIDARVRKTMDGEYDATLLASAGLMRLGLEQHIVEMLSLDVMLPAPGQGALAIQCRADDSAARDHLLAIDHIPTRRIVGAERAFLKALGSGCSIPVGAYGRINPQGELKLCGLVIARDGQQAIRVFNKGDNPQELGAALAREALKMGAGALLT